MSVAWVPKIGAEFGGYRLESLIGHGGMSIVYRAQNLNLERTVALKLLAPQLSEDESFRERFLRESRMAAALDHPNVIPIYEAGEEEGVFYIAMRYVDGLDLKTLLKQEGPLPVERASSIVGQVANALGAAHAKGLVHRDVKPANILIASGYGPEESDHVYLSDFGVVKHSASRPLTQTGMFVGTAEYASPEQIEGKELDGRADVYALGCVLYECLTGDPAYDRDSEVALMYAHLLEPPPAVRDKRPDLAPEVDEVVAKGMAKSRDDRFATPRDLAVALRTAIGAPGTSAGAATQLAAAGGTVMAQPPPAPATTTAPGGGATPPAAPATPSAVPAAAPSQAAPAAGDGTSGSGGSSRTKWIVAGIVAALLVAAAIVGAVLAFTGSSNNSSNNGNGGGGSPGAPQTLLEALMPTGIAKFCNTLSTPSPGAVETDSCTPGANAPSSFPNQFTLSFYPARAGMNAAYTAEKAKITIGKCGNVAGEQTWSHKSDGKFGGRRVCGIDKKTGDAAIVWTHEKLQFPNHFNTVGVALSSNRGSSMFQTWWNPIAGPTAVSALGKCRPQVTDTQCFAVIQKFEKKKPAT